MRHPIKWTSVYSGHETTINGFRVHRSNLESGRRLYWVCWFECPHYVAHHSRMSRALYSLQAVRKYIQYLESKPKAFFTLERLKQVKASLKRIDSKFPDYDDNWERLYSRYTRQFRDSDSTYKRMMGA